MIQYLDTSCLAKLYLDEAGSDWIKERVSRFHITASSWIAFPEMHSALSRRHKEGGLTAGEFKESLESFASDWVRFGKVPCEAGICRMAGNLASRHRLRGMDAIHLASALHLREMETALPFEFLSSDVRLNQAATKEGLRTHVPV